MTNKLLRKLLPTWKSGRISRRLKRLRLHGVVRKIGKTCKYYATETGRRLLIALLKVREHFIIPSLAHPS